MLKTRFEWDPRKDRENQEKHAVSFAEAQFAFADPRRVIADGRTVQMKIGTILLAVLERGSFGEGIITVRFTYREDVIRIFGAGYWRKGKQIHERENPAHRRTPGKPQGRR